MGTTCEVYPENKYTELSVNIQVPFCNKQQKGSDFDLDKIRRKQEAYSWDLLGSFSKRIIASLERRMHACQENLIRHLNDVEYSDEFGHIVYRRKDGSTGTFNVSSFKIMQEAVKCLRQSDWRGYISNPFYVDQTLKALLNDTEQNHSDEKILKYSDLISFLCELHLMGTQK